MIRIASILFFCYVISEVSAQKVSGTVVEAQTKEPVPFAGVFLMRLDSTFVASTNSDEKGDFNFNAVLPGNYFIEINFTGFEKSL